MDCIKLENDSSLVRIFNASKEGPAVDVYINDKLIFTDIKFKNFSKYIKLEEGNYRVDVYENKNTQHPLINQTVQINPNEVYTIAIIGNIGDLSLLVINDYASKTMNDDYSSFRVINLSSNISPIDIVVDGDTLFKTIGYKQGTIYADVNINEYNIKIIDSLDEKTLLKFKSKFNPNKIYTIYLVDNEECINIIKSIDGNTHICRERWRKIYKVKSNQS